jgi:hypothetical protein
MRLRFCFALAVLYFTAVLLFTVLLRADNDRTVYKLAKYKSRQSRLKQQLANKQLRLESLINPASLNRRISESTDAANSPQ